MKQQGTSTRLIYDNCAYQLQIARSTDPLAYQLYDGKFENCKKCVYENKFWRKNDTDVIDRESELRGLGRPTSKCNQFQYKPTCKKSGSCISTFDDSNPVILAPEVCPIVKNNIPRMTNPGYILPKYTCEDK